MRRVALVAAWLALALAALSLLRPARRLPHLTPSDAAGMVL